MWEISRVTKPHCARITKHGHHLWQISHIIHKWCPCFVILAQCGWAKWNFCVILVEHPVSGELVLQKADCQLVKSYWNAQARTSYFTVMLFHTSLSGQIRSYWHRDALRISLRRCVIAYFQISYNRWHSGAVKHEPRLYANTIWFVKTETAMYEAAAHWSN